jgi:hypothetical protein
VSRGLACPNSFHQFELILGAVPILVPLVEKKISKKQKQKTKI